MFLEYLNVVFTQILNSAVAVMNHPARRFSSHNRHPQCVHRQLPIDSLRYRVPDHLVREKVQDHREINEPIVDPNVCDVRRPHLVDAINDHALDVVRVHQAVVGRVRRRHILPRRANLQLELLKHAAKPRLPNLYPIAPQVSHQWTITRTWKIHPDALDGVS